MVHPLDMLLHVALLNEVHAAVGVRALEGLLVEVDPLMLIESLQTVEYLAAVVFFGLK